jgi:immune inhibitor A
MTTTWRRAAALTSGLLLALALPGPASGAPTGPDPVRAEPPSATISKDPPRTAEKFTDNLVSPLEQHRQSLHQQALRQMLTKQATPRKDGKGSTVVDLAPNQAAKKPGEAGTTTHAEVARTRTDKIFVILADFGTQRHPDYPDQNTSVFFDGPQRFDGPAANTIPQPNRLTDNTTTWRPNFDREYFQNLYFSREPGAQSLANYYSAQSTGQYTVDGEVSDWVRVPYNEARYGRSDGFPCTGHICSNVWALISDGVNAWVADQEAKGRTLDDIRAELSTFDQWDRYDSNNNGNFNEPDGYLDHFQIVHAGPDQASLSSLYGEDAIWSHRWYENQTDIGVTGPPGDKLGGAQIGDTGYWVGDYTIQAENAPMGVYTHEFGHDLGLPDEYDAYGNDAATGFWTLMSAGPYLGMGGTEVGGHPGGLSAWDKLQLGWLNFAVSYYGEDGTFDLGLPETPGDLPQALAVVLPEKHVLFQLGQPPEGTHAWWSGRGDNLHSALIRFLSLPAGAPAQLKFKAWYDMEFQFDTATVEVNDGTGWHTVAGSITVPSLGNVITGRSNGWKDATFDLSAYAGRTVQLRIRYDTDSSVTSLGLLMDQFSATSGTTTLFTDGAETGSNGWIPAGFRASTGVEDAYYPQYYLAEYRTYAGQDASLRTGPYNYGFLRTRPNFVEHYPYQSGLLVWQWDTSMTDNTVSLHPCQGQILAVDASPQIMRAPSGAMWRPRVQIYDAPFSANRTDAFRLHDQNVLQIIHSHPGVATFDDNQQYCSPELPFSGVTTAGSGTQIQVTGQSDTDLSVSVTYAPVPDRAAHPQ